MQGLDRSNFFEVTESRAWVRDDGLTASLFGAVPWTSDAEKTRWTMVSRGWTVFHKKAGTYGIGRAPWPTREAAEAWVRGDA